MSSVEFAKRHPNPTEADVRHWLEGNLCRCTGYQNIVASVLRGTAAMHAEQGSMSMSNVIGIGARPLRKEDQRFLTGRGNYVADIKRPDMVAGVFLRSPHAHAAIKSIDAARGAGDARRGRRVHRRRSEGRRRRRSAVRLGHHRQGRLADERAAAPGAGAGQGAPCRRSCRLRHRRDPRAGAEPPPSASWSTIEVLPAVVGVLDAIKRDAPLLFDDVPNNLCCDWALGDKAATDAAFRKAAHVARISLVNNRLVANPMEPRAAIGEYNAATGEYTLWTTSQIPHVVRLLMGAFVLNIPQHKLRVVAPDVGGGFGVKQFHYAEEAVDHLGRGQGRQADQMGLRAQRRLHLRCARPRSRHRCRAGPRRGRQVPGSAGNTLANIGGYLSTFGPNIPTNLYGPLLAGVYTTPAIYCEVKVVFTNTVPVDAYRGAGRPEATFVLERLVDVAASDLGSTRPRSAAAT